MRGTCRLAGSSSGIIAVDTVVVAVIKVPLILTPPDRVVGKLVLRITDRPFAGAELLSEFHCACRAVFHASSAGNAVFSVNMRDICASGEVRSVEQLARSERIADIRVAVADRDYLVRTVHIGYLMDISVVFRFLKDLKSFIFRNVTAAFFAFDYIVRDRAHSQTPVVRIVAVTFTEKLSAHSAGAGSRSHPVPFVEPVADMLNVDRTGICGNGFFYGNDMHSDPGSSGRHHLIDDRERKECHSFKESRYFRMFLHEFDIHVGVLRAAHYKHRQAVLLFVLGVYVGKLKYAVVQHCLEIAFKAVLRNIRVHFLHSFEIIRSTKLHSETDIRHFICRNHCRDTVVVRISRLYFSFAVRYLLCQLKYFLPYRTFHRHIEYFDRIGYVLA